MEVSPSPQEARRLVSGVVTFWLSSALLSSTGESMEPWEGPVFLVALVSIYVFYGTLFSVSGRETGRSAWFYFVPRLPRLRGPDNMMAVGREGWTVLLKAVNPFWWARVVRTTGWPVWLTAVALVGSLALVVSASFFGAA